MPVQIRLRAPSGTFRLDVDENATVSALIELIKDKTDLKAFTLKYSWPLKDLDVDSISPGTTVSDLKLRGETIVVVPTEAQTARPPPQQDQAESKPTTPPPPFVPKPVEPDETVIEWPERGGFLVLRVMPDDNSCLFTALGGALAIPDPSARLRTEVANYILSHPGAYSAAILGDEPARYVERMQRPDTWGGAIELAVLADVYGVEICSIDVKSGRVDRFDREGEAGEGRRVVILYSGIHYDRIAFAIDPSHPAEVDVTQWDVEDEEVLERAKELAKKLNRLHYYTDTTDFVIRCEVCNWIGQGARDAAKHERETGHREFGEMTIE